MSRKMPKQKPGKSETVIRTPPEFVRAVENFLGIKGFALDLAALKNNAVAPCYFTPQDDSLSLGWWDFLRNGVFKLFHNKGERARGAWCWLNPPYDNIMPWAAKCWEQHLLGCHIAFLVPYAPGTKWWRTYIHDRAKVFCVSPRLKFLDKDGNPILDGKGRPATYPKDVALVLYGDGEPEFDYFNWKEFV